MQLILEANNISVSTAHFGAFLEEFNLCKNNGKHAGVKGLRSHTNCHFQLISIVKIKKTVAVNKKSSFIFCIQFGTQNAGNRIAELPDFKILWGGMPSDPPRRRLPRSVTLLKPGAYFKFY